MNESGLKYSVRSGAVLGDADWKEVAGLFSASYGIYSQRDPAGRAGRQIRLSPGYYRRMYASDAYRIVVCREGERLFACARRLVAERRLSCSWLSRGRAVGMELPADFCRRYGRVPISAAWGW